MPTIIGFKRNITRSCEGILISNITLGGAVNRRRNEPVIEDDDGPASGRFFTIGNGEQAINFVTLRFI